MEPGTAGAGPPDLRELAERQILAASAVQRALGDLRCEGSAERGLVRATVGAGGMLLDLQLDPRAMRLDSHALRAAVLAAHAKAVEEARRRTDELMVPLISTGADPVNPQRFAINLIAIFGLLIGMSGLVWIASLIFW
jgi:DNA-binding protein YbaB